MSRRISQISSDEGSSVRPVLIVPERIYQHQKDRLAMLVATFLEKNPMSPEAFAFESEGTIYRVTQDIFEDFLVPMKNEYGSPVLLKSIMITPRTIREFIARLENGDFTSVRLKTWRYFYAFFASLEFLEGARISSR